MIVYANATNQISIATTADMSGNEFPPPPLAIAANLGIRSSLTNTMHSGVATFWC